MILKSPEVRSRSEMKNSSIKPHISVYFTSPLLNQGLRYTTKVHTEILSSAVFKAEICSLHGNFCR